MTIFFISDTHFNHARIQEYCPGRPGGNDVIRMNNILIDNWNSVVMPNDEVFHLGDVMMGHNIYWESTLNKLNGKLHLVVGNHDKKFIKKQYTIDRFEWIKDYHELKIQDEDAKNGKSQLIILSHYAHLVWNHSHKDSWHLFGHSHGSLDAWARERLALDVGVDAENSKYFPLSYEQIKKIMKTKKVKFEDHHNENTN